MKQTIRLYRLPVCSLANNLQEESEVHLTELQARLSEAEVSLSLIDTEAVVMLPSDRG